VHDNNSNEAAFDAHIHDVRVPLNGDSSISSVFSGEQLTCLQPSPNPESHAQPHIHQFQVHQPPPQAQPTQLPPTNEQSVLFALQILSQLSDDHLHSVLSCLPQFSSAQLVALNAAAMATVGHDLGFGSAAQTQSQPQEPLSNPPTTALDTDDSDIPPPPVIHELPAFFLEAIAAQEAYWADASDNESVSSSSSSSWTNEDLEAGFDESNLGADVGFGTRRRIPLPGGLELSPNGYSRFSGRQLESASRSRSTRLHCYRGFSDVDSDDRAQAGSVYRSTRRRRHRVDPIYDYWPRRSLSDLDVMSEPCEDLCESPPMRKMRTRSGSV
jgi:hypothetical protein